jgi:hypothetical protein
VCVCVCVVCVCVCVLVCVCVYSCFTAALPLLYCCCTAAVLLLYCCTAALQPAVDDELGTLLFSRPNHSLDACLSRWRNQWPHLRSCATTIRQYMSADIACVSMRQHSSAGDVSGPTVCTHSHTHTPPQWPRRRLQEVQHIRA